MMSQLMRGFAVAGRYGYLALLSAALVACGGGGGGGSGGGGGGGGGGGTGYTPGVFQPSSNFAARCVAPRAGTTDVTGTVADQNNWLRSWTNEFYLWYTEVPDLNPSQYQSANYFDLLKTSATTTSGTPKDKFHFTYDTNVWQQLSQGGVEVSYGLSWAIQTTTTSRTAFVAFLEPSPPASTVAANLMRGVEVLTVDGTSINDNTTAGINALNAGLFPSKAGESHSFGIRRPGGALETVTLQSTSFTSTPVQNVTTLQTLSGQVGYILFNDHIATAESQLVNAITTLKNAGITDLVLDIRYNGGGFLDIASELAYMIAGPASTAGQTFERLQFNDKYPNTNPITKTALTPTPFHTTTQGIQPGFAAGQALPTLDLPRVFVLTGGGTCSASESIINSLRGVNVQVVQIGSTTCGKPYGFYPQDDCGTTYFTIQFRGVNAANFGDYTDGFKPANSLTAAGTSVPGCSVADDFTHALGDPNEGRLAAAMSYRANGACAGPPTGVVKAQGFNEPPPDFIVPKSPWLDNRILRPE
jgi:carboxyl-terminal processing protease